jgi:sigma-54-specific transcriptional regulator
VLPLARHFIGVYGPRLGVHEVTLAPDAEAALNTYPWPGNIRELENVIHFALIVCRSGRIVASDLKLVTAAGLVSRAPAHAESHDTLAAATPQAPAQRLRDVMQVLLSEATPELFETVEETLVRAAFSHAGDNQVRAARVLGVTRNTLRTLLKRYGLLGASRDEPVEASLPMAH